MATIVGQVKNTAEFASLMLTQDGSFEITQNSNFLIANQIITEVIRLINLH